LVSLPVKAFLQLSHRCEIESTTITPWVLRSRLADRGHDLGDRFGIQDVELEGLGMHSALLHVLRIERGAESVSQKATRLPAWRASPSASISAVKVLPLPAGPNSAILRAALRAVGLWNEVMDEDSVRGEDGALGDTRGGQ